MRYRTIAGTDIRVSEIGFGVWTLTAGWWGQCSDQDAVRLLQEAADLGVTFFDTAPSYGDGRGETILAQAFPGAARDRIIIGTKFGYDWEGRTDRENAGHQEAPHRWDVPLLERSLTDSLRRLGTDTIDHYQLHNARMDGIQNDAVWQWLERVQQDGRVRSVGVAVGPAIGWLAEGEWALRRRPAHTVQIIYNALELDPGRDFIRVARETGRSLLVRVPHSSGMLEGRYTEDTTFDASDHRRHRPRAWLVNGLKKIQQLDFLLEGGATLSQAALRYVLKDPEIVSALPNIYNREQLHEFAAAAGCPDMTPEQVQRVEALFDSNYGLPREQEAGVTRR